MILILFIDYPIQVRPITSLNSDGVKKNFTVLIVLGPCVCMTYSVAFISR